MKRQNRNIFVKIGAFTAAVCLLSGCTGGKEPETETTATTVTTTTTRTTGTPTTVCSPSLSGLELSSPTGETPDMETFERLAAVLRKNESSVSLYYKDLENGHVITYRADKDYQAASVIKAPYIKYLLASGEADLSAPLTYKTAKGGAVYIETHYKKGDTLPVKDVMEYTIRYSDNAGYYMLNREYAFEGFRAYGKSLGCNPKQCLDYPHYFLTARECGLYFEDIARYIDEGSEKAKLLFSWMTSTEETRQLPDAYPKKTLAAGTDAWADRYNGYTVAHKYGEQGKQAYHDSAIIWRDHPYVLCITSTLEPYADSSIATYHDIASLIDQLQTGWYS